MLLFWNPGIFHTAEKESRLLGEDIGLAPCIPSDGYNCGFVHQNQKGLLI